MKKFIATIILTTVSLSVFAKENVGTVENQEQKKNKSIGLTIQGSFFNSDTEMMDAASRLVFIKKYQGVSRSDFFKNELLDMVRFNEKKIELDAKRED